MEPHSPDDDSPSTQFPKLDWEEQELDTRPLPLHELPASSRIRAQLDVVQQHHPRIALTIESLWGTHECAEYINSLLMSAEDGDHHRMGFRPEVLTAFMNLIGLHQRD